MSPQNQPIEDTLENGLAFVVAGGDVIKCGPGKAIRKGRAMLDLRPPIIGLSREDRCKYSRYWDECQLWRPDPVVLLIPKMLWRSSQELRNLFRYMNDLPGVLLSRGEHLFYTLRWAYEMRAYQGSNLTASAVIEMAERVYFDAPVYLHAVELYIVNKI